MSLLIIAISFFWCLNMVKMALFWLYLWQLKEYHIGRFLDHFRTHKGERLLFGLLPVAKLLLLVALVTYDNLLYWIFYLAIFLYAGESFLLVLAILENKVKKPVFTKKTILLTLICFLVVVAYFLLVWFFAGSDFWFVLYLLIFDILIPAIVSLVVLAFQPFFVLARNNILTKAKRKIKQFPNLIVVGITGSYGKTSTKEFLTAILSQKFKVLATPEHKNSEMGIAETVLHELNGDHQVFIVEMGSYKKSGIKLLCDIVKPKIGVVTGVNDQHLALFGSLENLLSAEGGQELLKSLPQDGLLVVNGDNKYCVALYKKANTKKKIYSVKGDVVDSDIWTEDVAVGKDSLAFIARDKAKEMVHVQVNVLGKQNVQNLLGAMLVAKELGMSLEEVSEAAKNITQDQAGMTLKKGPFGLDIIDSSYSSNPDGVMADLDYLNVFLQKKVIVMPCLIELGAKSQAIHQAIGRKIAKVCDLAIITARDKFEDIKLAAVQEGMDANNILLCDKTKDIFETITTFCKEGDAVLLEGRVPEALAKLLGA